MSDTAAFEQWLELSLASRLTNSGGGGPAPFPRYRTLAGQRSLGHGDLAKLTRAAAAGFASAFVLSTSGALVASLAGHFAPGSHGTKHSEPMPAAHREAQAPPAPAIPKATPRPAPAASVRPPARPPHAAVNPPQWKPQPMWTPPPLPQWTPPAGGDGSSHRGDGGGSSHQGGD